MVLASSIALIVSMVLAGAVSDVGLKDGTISNFNGQGPVTVDVDCDPDTLNLKSNGKWITCYVEVEPVVESYYLIEQGALSEIVAPVPEPVDATSFYDYSSASSHTGFEEPHKSKFFLFKDTTTDEISLIIHHNIDRDGTGIITGPGRVDFDLEGVPPSGFISFVDDPNHVWDPPRTKEFSLSYPGMEGHWAYGDNTDGGVLSGLPNDESWSITIDPLYWESILGWEFISHVSGFAVVYSLDMSLPVTISHVVDSKSVEDIDRSTVFLNDIIPPELDLKYGFVTDPDEYKVDVDNDGIPELKLKFSRDDVQGTITASSPGLDFTIKGKFTDGTPFEGTDIIKVIGGG
jgi:hypothetical protein